MQRSKRRKCDRERLHGCLNWVTREGLSEVVSFKLRCDDSRGGSHVQI